MTTSDKEEFDKALELLRSVSEAGKTYDRLGAICEFEGNDMIYADQLMEIVEKVNVFLCKHQQQVNKVWYK